MCVCVCVCVYVCVCVCVCVCERERERERESLEEVSYGKMVGLSQQGAWTRWEDVRKKRVRWSDCWRPDFNEIRFLIKSVYDVLPSPTNLHIWGKIEIWREIRVSLVKCKS